MREEKRSEIIHDALNFLDEEMIEDVEKLRGYVDIEELEHGSGVENQVVSMKNVSDKTHKKKYWHRWTSVAAGICVLILGGWMVVTGFVPEIDTADEVQMELENSNDDENYEHEENITDDANREEQMTDEVGDLENIRESVEVAQGTPESMKTGVTIPEMKVSLKKEEGLALDMIGLFIYEGRCYVQYDYIRDDANFVGECVGSVNGLIDEWTEADGYVEGAGTFTGKIYEVEGVNPEFMLCTIWDNGVVETYINNNGITLGKGSDLVDDRLHLRDNVKTVSYQTDEEWNHTLKEPTILSEEYHELFEQFLDSFAENEFACVEGKSYNLFGGNSNNSHIYHLYFTTENGVVVRFTLMGDGYVCFPWLNGVCVQIDPEIYDNVVEVFKKNLR